MLVAFDPARISYADLLKVFFEEHDPTQGMRQGNDVGTQYRSGIYFTNDAQKATAEMALRAYDEALRAAGHDPITTEVEPAGPFYYAEDYHQQYLHKVPERLLRPRRHRRLLPHPRRCAHRACSEFAARFGRRPRAPNSIPRR